MPEPLRLTAAQRDALLAGCDWIEANPSRWIRKELVTFGQNKRPIALHERDPSKLCYCALGAAALATLPAEAVALSAGADCPAAETAWNVELWAEDLFGGELLTTIGEVNDRAAFAFEAAQRIRDLVKGATIDG